MSPTLQISQGILVHGGVGTMPAAGMTPEAAASYRDALAESLLAGRGVLRRNGCAMDAASAAVRVMEDSPLFNAGRGSNFDERGIITMDASVMDGSTLGAGAVAGVTDVRSPVRLAQRVMERSEHVMLIGEGAEAFARQQGIESTEASFFHTDRRWTEMQKAKANDSPRPNVLGDDPAAKSGTVGAVVLDGTGRLAAATSTGGMANKTWGRVGDSPVIGAGTYASGLCAVSCTGWGEYFIKNASAFAVHARMCYGGATLAEAVRGVVFDTLGEQMPGTGGLIAIDAQGRAEFCFNTPGMYRGWVGAEDEPHVAIYEEDWVPHGLGSTNDEPTRIT